MISLLDVDKLMLNFVFINFSPLLDIDELTFPSCLSWGSFLSVTNLSQNFTFFLLCHNFCDIIPHGVKIHTQENSSVECV